MGYALCMLGYHHFPAAFERYLAQSYTDEAFRQLVRLGPKGDEISTRLSGTGANVYTLAAEAIRLWIDRRCVDDAFFGTLLESRPQKEAEIRSLQALWKKESGVWPRFLRIALSVAPLALLVVLPSILAFLDASAAFDAWFQYPLVRAVRGDLPAENVVVLSLGPTDDPRSFRGRHADMVRGLADAGAAVIAFDLAFSAETAEDAAFAEAVREVSARGVPVIVPVRFDTDSAPILPGSPALREATRLGAVEMEADRLTHTIRRVPVRLHDPSGATWWSLGVRATQGALRATADPEVDGDRLVVGALKNRLHLGCVYLHPSDPPVTHPYGAVPADVRDKAVLIGVVGGGQDVHRTPNGVRYGVEIQAALVETLLQQAALPVVPAWMNALASLLAGLGAFGLARFLPKRRWVAIVAPVAVLGVQVALALSGILVAILPVLVSSSVGLFAGVGRAPARPTE